MGNRQSFSARQRERIAMSFETKQTARERIDRDTSHQQAPKRKKKDHTGKIDQMNWDKDSLKAEVEGYDDSFKINWSDLARKYHITNKRGELARNGGQIAQECLIKQGVNLHRFKRPNEQKDEPRIRRKKLRGIGGKFRLLMHFLKCIKCI